MHSKRTLTINLPGAVVIKWTWSRLLLRMGLISRNSSSLKRMLLLCLAVLPLTLAAPNVYTSANLYDDTVTRNKIFPLAAAAYSDTPANCVNNVFPTATFKRQLDVSCDWTIIDKCSSYTAVSPDDQIIIISFRGGNSDLEMIMEGDETLFKNNTPWVAGGSVSKFFNDGFNKLWSKGLKDDFLSHANKYPKFTLWITGHSLGGALASLAASFISHNKLFPAKQIVLTTFGQPRTGDQAWAKAHDKEVPVSFRITHGRDPVPHFPLINQEGYTHHLTEAYYHKGMEVGAKYYVCSNIDESYFCSDANILPDTSIKEHSHYFEKQVKEYGKAGCV